MCENTADICYDVQCRNVNNIMWIPGKVCNEYLFVKTNASLPGTCNSACRLAGSMFCLRTYRKPRAQESFFITEQRKTSTCYYIPALMLDTDCIYIRQTSDWCLNQIDHSQSFKSYDSIADTYYYIAWFYFFFCTIFCVLSFIGNCKLLGSEDY